MKIFEKGFIGAIGDDLPSLIPIVFALLIFFTIFTTTLSTYNGENARVSTEIGMLSVARTLKGDSLLLNLSQFQTRCADVRVQSYPYNFMIAVYKADKDLDTVMEDFIETSISNEEYSKNFLTGPVGDDPEGTYFCGYKKIGSKDFGDTRSGSREEYILRYYPIAIQTQVTIGGKDYYIIIPGIMAMVIW